MNVYTVNGRALIAANQKDAIAAYDKTFRRDPFEPIVCKLLHLGVARPPAVPKVGRLDPRHLQEMEKLKGEALVGSAFSLRRRAQACL